MKSVRFSFFIYGTSINRMTDYDSLDEVKAEGLERVADKCIEEIKHSTGIDLKELSKSNDYLSFCKFIQLEYDHKTNEITEKNRIEIKKAGENR